MVSWARDPYRRISMASEFDVISVTRNEREMPRGSLSPTATADETADVGPSESLDTAADAFVRSLYTEYAAPLVSVVMRLNGGDRQWAEDVAQETFIRAWRHTRGLLAERGSRSMMPWLVTVARRIVINDRRSRGARPMEVDDALLSTVAVPDDTERMLLRKVLGEALAELTPAHRTVVVEICIHDRTTAEVSDLMGIPCGTVKSRMYYALRHLRSALEEREIVVGAGTRNERSRSRRG